MLPNKKSFLIGSILILMLSGCMSQPLKVEDVPIQRDPLNIPDPTPLQLNRLTWTGVARDGGSYYCVSPEDFQKYLENQVMIGNYIVKNREILKQYRQYYSNQHTKKPN